MTEPANHDDRRRGVPEDDEQDPPGFSLSPGFVRGLTLGALVGAAIAGSAIWDRLRRRSDVAPGHDPESPPDAG